MMKRLISISLILFSVALLFSEESDVWKKVEICGVEMEWDGYRVKEDGSDLDPYTTLFSDIAEDGDRKPIPRKTSWKDRF